MSSEKLVKCPICGEEVAHDEAYPGSDPNVTPRQVLNMIRESIENLDEEELVDLFKPEPVLSDDPENSGRIKAL